GPSASVVVSSCAENGAAVSVAIVVHVPLPASARSKSTDTVSGSEVAVSVTVPLRLAPGSLSVGTGERLSTVIVRRADVVLLPAMSVTTTWIVAAPSGPLAEFHVVEYGAVVSVSSGEPITRNCKDAIGDVTSAVEGVIPR